MTVEIATAATAATTRTAVETGIPLAADPEGEGWGEVVWLAVRVRFSQVTFPGVAVTVSWRLPNPEALATMSYDPGVTESLKLPADRSWTTPPMDTSASAGATVPAMNVGR